MILQVRKKQPGHNHLDKNNHQSHKNPSVGTRAFTRDDSCSETAPQCQAQPARAHIRRFSQAVLPSAEILVPDSARIVGCSEGRLPWGFAPWRCDMGPQPGSGASPSS